MRCLAMESLLERNAGIVQQRPVANQCEPDCPDAARIGRGGTMALTKAGFLAALLLAGPALAEEAQDFYRGRSVTLMVGHEAGTGYDLYGRTLARHIGRHIPGEPALVVQNMPGAGGLNAANWLFNVAPRDGSVIMLVAADPLFEPLFGGGTARLDPVGFSWIGNLDESPATCDVAAASGIARFEDLLAREAVFGA